MDIAQYNNYKSYIKDWVKNQPSKGRGLFKKMCENLRISTVTMSQIVSGSRDFTDEQVIELGAFLKLSELEIEYFSYLVRRNRAGTMSLKKHCDTKISKLKNELQKLDAKLTTKNQLSENSKNIFYSNWYFSAIRLATSLSDLTNREHIAKRLNLVGIRRLQTSQWRERSLIFRIHCFRSQQIFH